MNLPRFDWRGILNKIPMSEASISQRLQLCFQAVFPKLRQPDIGHASSETVPDWDSVAQVTLISVVEEEFAMVVPETEYGDLLSFEAWSAYLETLQG
jgi:acyl carrier protein